MRRLPNSSARAFLVWLLFILASAIGCGEAEPQRDVLLVTVDTLRADFVGSYGFAHPTTPRIDGLAAEGVLFESAIAAASLTAPAHASIMTSRYAREHSLGTLNGETTLEGLPTLADHFAGAGYATAAFVSNVVLRRRSGLDRGFEGYEDQFGRGELNRRAMAERPAEVTVGLAIEWLEGRGDRPFFLWVHVQDPHGPYDPPAPFRGRIGDVPLRVKRPLAALDRFSGRAGIPSYQVLGELRDPAAYAGLYAEEILYTDHWVGRLVDAVDGLRRERGTVVLLTADHGESMGEDGWFFQHGQATTPELARVPFIVRAPGVAPRRILQRVSHVDIAPTLAELAGLVPFEGSGVSLAPLLLGGRSLDERVIFSDTEGEAGVYTARGQVRARGSATAIKPPAELEPLRFQAAAPNEEGEWRPAPVQPEDRELLMRYIEARVPPVAAGVMEPEHIEQLRALGYLEDDPAEIESGSDTPPAGGGEQ